MRRLLQRCVVPVLSAIFVAVFAVPTLGLAADTASTKPSKPTDLQPLPEPPPAPAGLDANADEPQVTITKRGEDKAEELRVNGKLYMIKVTPKYGAPYYLMDEKGDGTWAKQESTDFGVRVPHWVVGTF